MKKKCLALLLTFVLIAGLLAGCSQDSNEVPDDTNKTGEIDETDEQDTAGDDYPNKPITLLIGFSAGGSSDVMVRLLANSMEKYIGQPVVVVNKPGAGGWIVWEEMVKSIEPDGYTFSHIATPYFNLGAYDNANPRPYNIDDFDLLANHVTDYNVIAIRNDETRFNDLESLIEYGKENTLLAPCSATGILSDDATVLEYLNKNFGTKFEIVQTGGAKDSEVAFISGNSDIMVANIADTLSAYNNGDYDLIAIFSPERSELLPDVPTISELGFGDIEMFSARGYTLPKGVDPAIKEILLDAIEKAIHDPEVKDKLLELGAQTDFMKGQDFYDFLNTNIEDTKTIYGID